GHGRTPRSRRARRPAVPGTARARPLRAPQRAPHPRRRSCPGPTTAGHAARRTRPRSWSGPRRRARHRSAPRPAARPHPWSRTAITRPSSNFPRFDATCQTQQTADGENEDQCTACIEERVRTIFDLAWTYLDSLPLVDQLAAEVGPQALGVLDRVLRASQQVAVQDHEVRQLARLHPPDLVLQEHQVGVVDRVEADGLLAADRLLGVQLTVVPPGPAR